MEEKMARAQLPIWAAERIFDEPEKKAEVSIWTMIKHTTADLGHKITKKYAIAGILAVTFVVYGWIIAEVTEHRVTEDVTEAVTSQMRGEFQKYIEEQENARMAAGLITGDASRQAAADDIADALAPLIAGLRMDGRVTKQGAYTYGWTIMSRLHSGRYGGTIHEVLGQEGQYEYYDPNHSCREEDRLIAAEIAEDYIAGNLPSNGFTWRIEFAVINADGSVTARDDYKVGNMTQTWRYPE